MVFRLKTNRHLFCFLTALLLSLFFCFPLFRGTVSLEHDTFFHLSRIEGLASSIRKGNFFPAMYPAKNNHFGYASPLFYCDVFLIPSAVLYALGLPLSFAYSSLIFSCTFLTCLTVLHLLLEITNHRTAALLVTTAYLFCNYRISDVYVRSAMGEVMAMVFLPILLSGIRKLLYRKDMHGEQWLFAGLCGLVLSHNLSFFLGVLLLIIFCLLNISTFNRQTWTALFRACLAAFLLTCFFTLPMLEQTASQKFWLHYYGTSSRLEDYTMPMWKYFANKTIFGLGDISQARDRAMLVNIGLFLSFTPLLYLFLPKGKKDRFSAHCLILGYLFFLLPAEYVPWKDLFFLRILQFPWRLNMISSLLLCIPASRFLAGLKGQKAVPVLCALLLAEGFYHLKPVLERTFVITFQTTYTDIISGALCDPYYAATYVRVECAGGDYLPQASPDFRSYPAIIKDASGRELPVSFTRDEGMTIEVPVEMENTEFILPLTWYKGYVVLYPDGKMKTTFPSERALVSFTTGNSGIYQVYYKGTILRSVSYAVSFGTLVVILVRRVIMLRLKKPR